MARVQLEKRISVSKAIENLGFKSGHSGNGWSINSAYQQCKEKFRLLLSTPKEDGPDAEALEIGIVLHWLLQLHYHQWELELKGHKDILGVDHFFPLLMDQPVMAEYVIEGRRLYDAYLSEWEFEKELVRPILVEHHLCHHTGYTSRIDLLLEILNDHPKGYLPGYYLIDHKTASAFTSEVLECWRHDGEIIGQQVCWLDRQLKDSVPLGVASTPWNDRYPIRGSLVNIIGKQKEPKFHRALVPLDDSELDRFRRELYRMQAEQKLSELNNDYPRNRTACLSRYGRCQFYSNCWG